MMYLIFPHFYNKIKYASSLIGYVKNIDNSDKLKFPFKPLTISKYIPCCYHNGTFNNCQGYVWVWKDIMYESSIGHPIPTTLNFANLYLNKEDFNDQYFNIILNSFETGSNFIELSSFELLDYLLKNYRNYKYILSSHANIINTFSPDIINAITEKDVFTLVSLPVIFNQDKEFLTALNDKDKILIQINSLCKNCSFECYQECIKKENDYQYNFSQNTLKDCSNFVTYNNKHSLCLSAELKQYENMGFHNFKLCDFPNLPNAFIDFTYFFADFFIKEEYQKDFICYMVKEGLVND